MQRFFAFIKRDAKHVFANVISLVVVVGMVVVPSFYAWFNIAGSWDPYGNTKNLKVAVANSDAGYTGDLIPVTLNMGERMTSSLTESTSIGYTVTTEEQAIEGVQSGEYYAAIVFPADFTTNMMSVLSSSPTKPKVLFYQNEKANAIAQIVTNKASTAVQQDIDQSFAESVTNVGAGVLDELTSYLDDDKLVEFTDKLNGAVGDAHRNGKNKEREEFSRARARDLAHCPGEHPAADDEHDGDEERGVEERLQDDECKAASGKARRSTGLARNHDARKGRQQNKDDDGGEVLHDEPPDGDSAVRARELSAHVKGFEEHHGRGAGERNPEHDRFAP